MKSHLLLTTIAAVVLVGCGPSQQSAPAPETEPIAEVPAQASPPPVEAKPTEPVEPVAEAPPPKVESNRDADNALIDAVQRRKIEAVKQAIAAGADVNAKSFIDGATLLIAIRKGYNDIVELLIANGANVNAKDDGKTPLDLARLRFIRYGEEEDSFFKIVDLLLKNGGKSGAEDSFHIAATMGNIEAVQQHLASNQDINFKDDIGRTALHAAAGADLDCEDLFNSPHANTHEKTQMDIVKLLIANGADLNAKDENGWTPLYAAVWSSGAAIAKLLIIKGADVNLGRDIDGITTIDFAALLYQVYGNYKIVSLLKEQGAKYSQIKFAAICRDAEAIKDLLAAGADINSKDIVGLTALDDVQIRDWESAEIKSEKKEIADLLRKHGGKTGEELKAEGIDNTDPQNKTE